LASYLLEKFSAWTNRANKFAKDGQLTAKFSLDDLLTNVMAYWTTDSITSSMRFYAENMVFDDEAAAFAR
jgi:juvenile hormone epoxide hydrolase